MLCKCKIYRLYGFAALVMAFAVPFSVVGVIDAAPSSNVVVFAKGLNNPRGLKFGPDKNLYVSEGGLGGTSINTVGQCTQVPAPIGPYTTDGPSARILKIDSDGDAITTVVDGLPSSQTSLASGGLVSGVADVAFIGRTLYALIAGAGCSHAFPEFPNSIIRVKSDGTFTPVANLSEFVMNNPVAQPNADDFEPDGTWYSMIAVHGKLYTVEPNHGELDQVSQGGNIRRIIDISATQGHIVPTALTFRHERDNDRDQGLDHGGHHRSKGNFYIGNLNVFPATVGESNIFKVTREGDISVAQSGVMTVLGVQFDHQGRLYVLETFTVPGVPSPAAAGTGAIVRFDDSGSPETIASGLTFPTAMTFGPDGKLYVSNFGFGAPPGAGQVVQITVPE
jgi:hypothetical protein